VYLTKCPSKTSGEPQKKAQIHRRFGGTRATGGGAERRSVHESLEGLAWLILENQRDAALMLPEGERTYRPRRIELGPHRELVFQPPDVIATRTLRRRHRYKDRCRMRRGGVASPQRELFVLMKDREGVTG
jgi:hypothetical protein